MDVRNQALDALMGRAIVRSESLNRGLREAILTQASSLSSGLPFDRLLGIEDLLRSWEPIWTQMVVDADFAATIAGTSEVVDRLPALAIEAIGAGNLFGADPPTFNDLAGGELGQPEIRYPAIEQAADNLFARRVLVREDFDELLPQQRREAFTVARESSEDALERIRDVTAESVATGESLRSYRKRLGEDLEASFIGPAHNENVFRTNIQTAYHDAHKKLADDPIVSEIFPYEEYLPIADSRVREEHLRLGKLGLNGTGIYRRDDPFWDVFRPPWGYQCRCSTNLLTIEAAARKGVVEARKWLRTGQPPASPEWRLDDIPFRPDPAFSGTAAAALALSDF